MSNTRTVRGVGWDVCALGNGLYTLMGSELWFKL